MFFPVSHGLIDDIIFVQVTKVVFEQFVDTNVARLKNTGAARRNEDKMDPRVVGLKP